MTGRAVEHAPGVQRAAAGRQGGQLLLAAGLLTLVNNYLPGSSHLDLAVLNGVVVVALVVGGACLVVPWERLPVRAPLVVLAVALAMLSVAGAYGNISPYSYAVYYVVVFVWVGIAQPHRTSLWVAPLAVLAYVLPFALADDPPPTAIGSVTVAVPVCVLVAEVLARLVARLESSRTEAVARGRREQAVVDVLADGVLVLDADGVVTSCNAAAATLLGVPRGSLVGSRPPLEIGPPGAVVHHTVGGRALETVAADLDVTRERVVAVRDVSRHRALDEAKDLFLATTSHELRTPLTAIKGYVHVLQRRWEVLDDAKRREALATVAERTDALVALTDHLLLGARAGAARHSAKARPFDLCLELTSALRGFDGLSDRHVLRVDLPDTPLMALGDPASLHHVVGQLVENAVKYSPGGGVVAVAARADGSFAVVEVTDEGVGIPEGSESSLFIPFFQAGAIDTREYGGVGLGLYIVRQLVEAQGGTVEAANRPGAGAVVRFTVPLAGLPALPDRTPGVAS